MKNLKIASKLFLSHTIIGLFSVLTLSFIFYTILRDSLIQRTVDQLSSINILKKNQVENYFSRIQKNIVFLSQKSTDLNQDIFEIHKLYEFNNITVVNNDFQIIYSSSPDTSFLSILSQQNLFYSSGVFGKTFSIIDASVYNPSKNTLLLYVVPLFAENKSVTGFIVIKENFQKIQNMLYERTGMGSTGESYFAANDFFMRSESRFFPGKAPLSIEVKTDAVENVFKGVADENIIKDYREIEVLSVSRKLNHPDLEWAIISEIDLSEAMKPINQLRNYFIIITFVIILLILLITYFISNAISKPVLYLKDIIIKLSQGIIPENKKHINTNDEIGQIDYATSQLMEGLKRTRDFAHEIGSGNFKVSYTTLSDKDSLGLALINMRDELKSLNEREVKLVREKGAALMEGQENERKRIIRELHDGIGQLLTVIKLRVEAMEDQHELKEEIKSLVNDTIAEVRRISYNVMPGVIVDFGLEAALKDLCENIKKHTGLSIDFTYVKDADEPLNFELRIAVFRIAQEGLNNIIKHAKATEADLQVVKNNDHIYLMLKDNGVGFSKESLHNKRGFGLSGIKERAKLLNGEAEVNSIPGSGTIIEVNIPLSK